MVCALLATAQPGGAGSESSELSELSEKFAFSPVGSRSYLARPLADGTAAGKSMGLCAPYPQQVRDLHHAEKAWSIFPYAVEPPTSRRNSEESLSKPSHRHS